MHRTGFCFLLAACALAFAVPTVRAQATPSMNLACDKSTSNARRTARKCLTGLRA
jgi:hypothetical protein